MVSFISSKYARYNMDFCTVKEIMNYEGVFIEMEHYEKMLDEIMENTDG